MSISAKTVALLNGPNLNLLGDRDPAIYGGRTLFDIERMVAEEAAALGYSVWSYQTNSEAGIVNAVHLARWRCSVLIINPGGLTHTSIALRDALELFPGPIAEVHLSDIYKRETFRHHSYVSLAATGVICGLGPRGYDLAIEAMAGILSHDRKV